MAFPGSTEFETTLSSPAEKSTPSEHFPIDPLRGLVVLGIVIFHMSTGSIQQSLQQSLGPNFEDLLRYFRLGVESFLLLAGFFLAHMLRHSDANYLSIPRFFARRFTRLALPYWIAILLAVATSYLANRYFSRGNPIPSCREMLSTALFLQDVLDSRWLVLYPLWSMAPLFHFYLIMGAIYWMIRRVYIYISPDISQLRARQFLIALCSLLTFLGPLPYLLLDQPEWQLPQFAGILALGAMTYWYVTRSITLTWYVSLIACAIFVSWQIDFLFGIKAAVCSLLVVYLSRVSALRDNWLTHAFAYFGRRSYSIYLTHGIFGHRVINLGMLLLDYPRDSFACLTLFTAGITASLIAGILFYQWVEMPVARLAARIRYRY